MAAPAPRPRRSPPPAAGSSGRAADDDPSASPRHRPARGRSRLDPGSPGADRAGSTAGGLARRSLRHGDDAARLPRRDRALRCAPALSRRARGAACSPTWSAPPPAIRTSTSAPGRRRASGTRRAGAVQGVGPARATRGRAGYRRSRAHRLRRLRWRRRPVGRIAPPSPRFRHRARTAARRRASTRARSRAGIASSTAA